MSEREFETWLSLLSGMLRLNPQQRHELSEELRTHLEDRLEDLIAGGLSREDAVASALEEFGDAAGLAHEFSQLSHLRKRRLIMRWTYGTIAASTCAILVLAAFWPQNNQQGPLVTSVAVSDELPGATSEPLITGASGSPVPAPVDDARSRIEAKLKQPIPDVNFDQIPFEEVVSYLSSTLEVDILVNHEALMEHGRNEELVMIQLTYGKVSTETLLELIFEQLDIDTNLIGYTIRDEVVYITDKSSMLETVVYNCRDLFPGTFVPRTAYGLGGLMGAGSGGMVVQAQYEGSGMMSPGYSPPSNSPEHLIDVIQQTVAPDSWTDAGGPGSIQLFEGLLVVKNTQTVHRDIEKLLEMMRAANGAGPAAQPMQGTFGEPGASGIGAPGAASFGSGNPTY